MHYTACMQQNLPAFSYGSSTSATECAHVTTLVKNCPSYSNGHNVVKYSCWVSYVLNILKHDAVPHLTVRHSACYRCYNVPFCVLSLLQFAIYVLLLQLQFAIMRVITPTVYHVIMITVCQFSCYQLHFAFLHVTMVTVCYFACYHSYSLPVLHDIMVTLAICVLSQLTINHCVCCYSYS